MLIVTGASIVDIFFAIADMPAPDQAIHLAAHDIHVGGKGANQAVAALRAGCPVQFFGAVGRDPNGDFILRELQRSGLSTDRIKRCDSATGLATIYVNHDDGTHRAVVSQSANLELTSADVSDADLGTAAALLVQGEMPLSETAALIERASDAGILSILNLAPAGPVSDDTLHRLDVLILNQHEARSVAHDRAMDETQPAAIARALSERFDLVTVITLGADGALAVAGGELLEIARYPVDVVDTLGAGDAFAGSLAASLLRGEDLGVAMRHAVIAGALACEEVGAQSGLPSRQDIDAAMSRWAALA